MPDRKLFRIHSSNSFQFENHTDNNRMLEYFDEDGRDYRGNDLYWYLASNKIEIVGVTLNPQYQRKGYSGSAYDNRQGGVMIQDSDGVEKWFHVPYEDLRNVIRNYDGELQLCNIFDLYKPTMLTFVRYRELLEKSGFTVISRSEGHESYIYLGANGQAFASLNGNGLEHIGAFTYPVKNRFMTEYPVEIGAIAEDTFADLIKLVKNITKQCRG